MIPAEHRIENDAARRERRKDRGPLLSTWLLLLASIAILLSGCSALQKHLSGLDRSYGIYYLKEDGTKIGAEATFKPVRRSK